MSVNNYVDETVLSDATSSFEKKAILLIPQPLTEVQKSQVKETLEIDSISSELTPITVEYTYVYDGDIIGIKWIQS